MKKLILVDGSSYLFRAYHALPYLTNNEGFPTGAIYGVINMLSKMPEQLDTKNIVIVFDAKGKNFRHDMFPEYKANRTKMADDLSMQIKPLHDIIKAMGFPLVSIPKVEADDVIGTIATLADEKNIKVVISTGDKDFAQLVNENIHLMDTMKNNYTTPSDVLEKYGVKPEQIIDFLALTGDKSDNIPGIPKCGPKTASNWLSEYGDIDNIIKNADKIKGKVGETFRENIDILPMSKDLVSIRKSVAVDIEFANMIIKDANKNFLKEEFRKYGFTSFLKRLEATGRTPIDSYNVKDNQVEIKKVEKKIVYEKINTKVQLDNWINIIKKSKIFAIDTETTSLNTFDAQLVGVSLSIKDKACYIPISHKDILGNVLENQLSIDYLIDSLKSILEDEEIIKIAHNFKYDLKILEKYNLKINGVLEDTMLMSYIFNSSSTRHNMDALAKKYLHRETISFEEVAGKGVKQITFDFVDIDKAVEYASEDAEITYDLYEFLNSALIKETNLYSLYKNIEIPVMTVIKDIEINGVMLDEKLLNTQSVLLGQKIAKLELKAFELAGEKFNLNSPKQLREILFKKLELPFKKKTKSGVASTSEEILSELAQVYELPEIILEYRHFAKLKNTYTDKLPNMIESSTGRVHTSYMQSVTSTGRLSSTNPNLQNIPVKTKIGREIRKAFIVKNGYTIVAGDYSQIELRIMAHLSEDKALVDAFNNGIDVHSATASEVLSVKFDDVTQDDRRKAKTVNFGLIYGMSAFGLAKQLNIGRNEAQDYINKYFEKYSSVKNYMERCKIEAQENGFVETVMHRRLHLPDINNRNMIKKKASERLAINAPMQGTAADIIKKAMIDIQTYINSLENNDISMIMQVHDELVFEIKTSMVDTYVPILKKYMENAESLNVPLVVEFGQGENWDEAH